MLREFRWKSQWKLLAAFPGDSSDLESNFSAIFEVHGR
jgi:hypothetical protein